MLRTKMHSSLGRGLSLQNLKLNRALNQNTIRNFQVLSKNTLVGVQSRHRKTLAFGQGLRYISAEAKPLAQEDSEEVSADGVLPLSRLRNLAIIAHVDHGKTTLVDCLLKQSGTLSTLQGTGVRVMDHNDLERERGITILSKCTSVMHKNHRINIVDTPGHADFGGEVERILSMVDGVVLVVDATEGPMTQTKFVLAKALQRGLRPLVVLNKVDRPSARPEEVDSELLDLFALLGASDEQMDYTIMYASAKEGWAIKDMSESNKDAGMQPLLDMMLDYVPAPKADRSLPFQMLVTQLDSNPFLGKCYLGRIHSGRVKVGDGLRCLTAEGAVAEEGRVTKIFLQAGLEKVVVEAAGAGDIVSIAGLSKAGVNTTLCAPTIEAPLPAHKVDPPTVSMIFNVNTSPLAGTEGKMLTSTVIGDRLFREAETNVALQITESESGGFEVRGRGELQLGVLIETMRREGFELSISPPKVVFKRSENKKDILEPIEEVTIDVEHAYAGVCIEKLSKRKGDLKNFGEFGEKARLILHVPTRGLLGYSAEFKNDTHGQGVLNHTFHSYMPFKGPLESTRKGALLSSAKGEVTHYAASLMEPRGKLFVVPGMMVYPGMVVGEYNKGDSDLEVNPARTKAVTNMRSVIKDETVRLTAVKPMSLEEVIAYVAPDEIIEVTPKSVRLRKKELDHARRRQSARQANNPMFDSVAE
ncbi:hypothetical protein DSO57_1032026 [Entomophthora muscae]|uniref:Uncharacterized protein n=1 Tax=Entomophthora muscae TaxID=34485 RepID=A0ACC2SPP0_9FUNG|nr:hypothetical protein DSO57_1032026 [Entomophthora muscae]